MEGSPPTRDELADPRTWGADESAIETIETHISVVVLVGQRAFKVKKPVRFEFLDFGTLERRRQACLDEVRLNRRLAPAMYAGVVPLYRAADGALRAGRAGDETAPGTIVEWAVAMRRLPAERMLDRQLEHGVVDNALLERLARLLSGFHAAARTGPGVDEHGSAAAVAANARENLVALEASITDAPEAHGVLGHATHALLARTLERDLERLGPLLERRVRAGRIREGHGDLHAGNVCVLADELVVYDCIEFSERFRCSDVACDLAFLTMDLRLAGFAAFAGYLAHRYAALAGDAELERLMPFYERYRALVRAKIAAIVAGDATRSAAVREAKRMEALRHVHLALAGALPPTLILTAGLPASGKSTLARALAVPLDAELHASDVRRKQLAGVPTSERHRGGVDRGLYTPAAKARTYDSLLHDVAPALESGRTLIVDAAFTRAEERRPFVDAARRLERPVRLVLVEADEPTTRRRLERRRHDPHAASDADEAVHAALRARFEPPDELPADWVVRVQSTDRPSEPLVARVLNALAAG